MLHGKQNFCCATERADPSQRIGEYLESRDMPSCENVCKLAKAFGVSTDYLLGVDVLQPTARNKHDIEHFKVPVT